MKALFTEIKPHRLQKRATITYLGYNNVFYTYAYGRNAFENNRNIKRHKLLSIAALNRATEHLKTLGCKCVKSLKLEIAGTYLVFDTNGTPYRIRATGKDNWEIVEEAILRALAA